MTSDEHPLIPLKDGHIDTRRRVVIRDEQRFSLTEQELQILVYLSQAKGEVVSTSDLHHHAWTNRQRPNSRAATFAVMRLRKKLEANPAQPIHLLTVHGRGFRWASNESPAPSQLSVNDWLPQDSFVGRTESLLQIQKAFSAGKQLVSLLGPAGIGKTRLAKEWARTEIASNSVWFCDLTPCQESESLQSFIEQAMGITLSRTRSLGSDEPYLRAHRQLHPRGVLILDNCEPIIEAVSMWVQRALPHLGTIRILVTSRERLRVHSEHPITVPPLANQDAIQLLEDRGAEDVVERLKAMQRCDGLPLALELAADSAQEQSDAVELSKDDPLAHAFETSWSQLSSVERMVLAQSSIFAGSFDWGAAEQILHHQDAPIDPLEPLEALVDKSILQVQDSAYGPRFSLLQNIKLMAAKKHQENGTLETTIDRYIAYFQSRDHKASQAKLEMDNYADVIRLLCARDQTASIRLILAARTSFRSAGRLSQLWHLTETLPFELDQVDSVLAANFLDARAFQLFCQGKYAASEEAIRKGLSRVEPGSMPHARLLSSLGNIHHSTNRSAEAKTIHMEALEAFKSHQAFNMSAMTLGNIALSCCELGQYEQALTFNEEVRRFYWNKVGSQQVRYHLISGYINQGMDDIDTAIENFQDAVATAIEREHLEWERVTRTGLGVMRMLNAENQEARAELERAWDLMPPQEEVQTSALLAIRQSQCALIQGRIEDAHQWADTGELWAGDYNSHHINWSLRLLKRKLANQSLEPILGSTEFQSILKNELELRITVALLDA